MCVRNADYRKFSFVITNLSEEHKQNEVPFSEPLNIILVNISALIVLASDLVAFFFPIFLSFNNLFHNLNI